MAALDYTFERREGLIRKEEREEGEQIGLKKGLDIFIQDKIEDGIEKDVIIRKVVKRFSITEEEALNYYENALNIV